MEEINENIYFTLEKLKIQPGDILLCKINKEDLLASDLLKLTESIKEILSKDPNTKDTKCIFIPNNIVTLKSSGKRVLLDEIDHLIKMLQGIKDEIVD